MQTTVNECIFYSCMKLDLNFWRAEASVRGHKFSEAQKNLINISEASKIDKRAVSLTKFLLLGLNYILCALKS